MYPHSSFKKFSKFAGIATLNKEIHTNILQCLRDTVGRKCPEKWRTNSWYLLHDSAPAHWSVLVKNFSAMNTVTILQHPQYSPDLAPADFLPVPLTEIRIEGRALL